MLSPQSPPPQPGAGVRTLNLLHRHDDSNLPLKTGFAHLLETRREPRARRLRLGQVIREEEKKGKTTSILAPDAGERGAAGDYSEMTDSSSFIS